jgi:hypothetical protein
MVIHTFWLLIIYKKVGKLSLGGELCEDAYNYINIDSIIYTLIIRT